MTDEQIIIDGVDVARCEYYDEDKYYTCTSENAFRCEECPICYFKQLGRLNTQYNAVVEQNKNLQGELNRKTQEGEELKKQLDEQVKTASRRYSELNPNWNDRCKKYDDDLKQLVRYRKALEEIKEIACRLRTKRDYNSPDEVNDDIDSILQKCEVINSESKET